MDVPNREVYKRVSAGTLGRGAEMKGGAGNHVNTARVCVYTCVRVCVPGLHSAGELSAAAASRTPCRRLPNINASLPAHSAACKRSVYPPEGRPSPRLWPPARWVAARRGLAR